MAVNIGYGAIFIPIFIASVEARSEIREYNPDVHVPIHGEEQPVSWFTPGILLPELEHGLAPVLGLVQPHAPYLGQVIAGRAEFPWIVDVSNTDLDQELHGIGNLISGLWVVTAGHLFEEWAKTDECGPSESGNYQVRFCSLYLQEDWYKWADQYVDYLSDYRVYHINRGRDDRGARIIHSIVRHPLCTRFSREYDVMLLKMNEPIDPWPPEIGYMPIWGTGYEWITQVDVETIKTQVCYVATFGRSFRGLPHPVNLDYKTKYRVYPVDWKVCSDKKDYICNYDRNFVDLNCEFFFDQGSEDFGGRQLMCLEMRNHNGAICNHDQGAPVVCDGLAVGFVVRGVGFDMCRSGSPFPVVAVKIDTFTGGFFVGKPMQQPITRHSTQTTPDIIPLYNFTRRRSQTIDWQKYILNNEKLSGRNS